MYNLLPSERLPFAQKEKSALKDEPLEMIEKIEQVSEQEIQQVEESVYEAYEDVYREGKSSILNYAGNVIEPFMYDHYEEDAKMARSYADQALQTAGRFVKEFKCLICGEHTHTKDFQANFRESCGCARCGATLRHRKYSATLVRTFNKKLGTNFLTLPEAVQSPALSNQHIFNTETTGIIDQHLRSCQNYVHSEFLGVTHQSGEVVGGILHQNLMETSYADDTFDFVLTSEVFEHIPFPYTAFQEIYRILKPGGYHVMSVPHVLALKKDRILASLDKETGEITYHQPPQYHGEPNPLAEGGSSKGILCYTVFGQEMIKRLHAMGFEVEVEHIYDEQYGLFTKSDAMFTMRKK
eukprot:Awhi_evm1s2366